MKKKITDYDIRGKKVIIRCDLNVPIKDKIIQDDTRIKASLETIKYCIDNASNFRGQISVFFERTWWGGNNDPIPWYYLPKLM